MRKLMYGGSLTALLIAAGIAAPGLAMAATADATASASTTDSGVTSSEVIVTGTRQQGVTAADSPAPVQVVGQSALVRTGAVDLPSALFTEVPSLNVNTTGGDMAALSIQAALRGLSPNDTLVLVDGKRRHDTSNLAVDTGSAYTGSATVDLSFIPVAAIDHVEVLTDGAAAQYGTDAIAGVVNIILKKNTSGGSLMGTGGAYYDQQGATGAWSINNGWSLGDNGFLNVTLEEKYHNYSEQGTGDRRFQNPNGTLLPGLTFPESDVTSASGYPNENKLNGDPEYNLYSAEYNAGYDFSPDLELYSFGTAGYRLATHYENYRTPNKISGVTSTGSTVYPLPNGFDPQEEIKELDGSFTVGLKGKLAGWRFDLASTYGSDNNDIYVINSANAQLFPVLQALSKTPVAPQRNFYNGTFNGTQEVVTLDLDNSYDIGWASPLNIAFGGEYRDETFSITAGEPSSYYGAGAQSFDGYTPQDQGSHSRTNYSGYVDVAVDPIKSLHVDAAGRYESYSDAGTALVGKGTARYDFNDMFALRGTISSGFRAPTLAEEFYSGTNVSPDSAAVSLPPNSAAAQLAGFAPLKPETSVNYSLGLVAHPMDHMQITLDGYDIQISNRIVETGFVYGTYEFAAPVGQQTISQGVLNAITARGVTLDSGLSYTGIQLFTNGANTTTTGIDLTGNYASDFGDYGHVDWTVGFNWNKTTINKTASLPATVTATYATAYAKAIAAGDTVALAQEVATDVASLGQSGSILGPTAIKALTDQTPQEKFIGQAFWNKDQWSVNARVSVYGPTSSLVEDSNGSTTEKINTTAIFDLDLGYKITEHIKVDLGANNLFNTFPPKTPIVGGIPVDGALVYNVPYAFAPWGINGGYYYGRIAIDW
jgi:iron complex outermembrane receptor protein